jgi:hypothetical protein
MCKDEQQQTVSPEKHPTDFKMATKKIEKHNLQ